MERERHFSIYVNGVAWTAKEQAACAKPLGTELGRRPGPDAAPRTGTPRRPRSPQAEEIHGVNQNASIFLREVGKLLGWEDLARHGLLDSPTILVTDTNSVVSPFGRRFSAVIATELVPSSQGI